MFVRMLPITAVRASQLRLAGLALGAVAMLACGDSGGDVRDTADTIEGDTADTVALDTADTMPPDTADTSEPDTADTSEPDTVDTIEPDTADTMTPDTADTSEPDTVDTVDTFMPPTTCEIDGTTYDRDRPNPANACERCDPGASSFAWTAFSGSVALFDGAVDYASQGWALASQAPFTATLVEGALELQTTTSQGANTSGQALLWRTLPLPTGAPFAVEFDLRLDQASRHNQYDAGAALLAAFTANFGTGAQRAQMIYLEGDGVGFADDSASASLTLADGAFHTLKLSVDADLTLAVSVDGVERLRRANFAGNGIIAVGDQTNDKGVDGTKRVRAVRLLCP